MSCLFIQTMEGLGDSIYQRALVRDLAQRNRLTLLTPWPELYEDIPRVSFARHPTRLRTQQKNLTHQTTRRWVGLPHRTKPLRLWYGPDLAHGGTILDILARKLSATVRAEFFNLPSFGPAPLDATGPIALLRPVTIRKEWQNTARAPRPEYIAAAAALLMPRYHVVSVADLAPGEEWLELPEPPAHTRFHAGQLNVGQLLALVQHAAVVVGGVGWIAPAAVAARRPLVLIGGGQGGHNAPERIFHPTLDLSRTRWILPEPYCRCVDMKHACDKDIADFPARFRAALDEVERAA